MATNSVIKFNFDAIQLADIQDNARQNITKKKFFPRGMIDEQHKLPNQKMITRK